MTEMVSKDGGVLFTLHTKPRGVNGEIERVGVYSSFFAIVRGSGQGPTPRYKIVP